MPRVYRRLIVLALAVTASMTFIDLGTVSRSLLVLLDTSQSRELSIRDEVQAFKEKQVQYESTIVTAYFQLNSTKHEHEHYMEWAKTSMCINDALVIFTQPKFVDEFFELRSHATNRTLIIPMEVEDIEVGDTIHYPDEFWKNKNKFWGPGWTGDLNGYLYKIWLAKTWFVNQAIRLNPFNSSVYSWMDIGHIREKTEFCGDVVVRHPEIVPDDGRIMLFMYREVKEADEDRYDDAIFSEGFPSFYIMGGWIAGGVDAWPRFMSKMEESIVLYDQRGVGLAEDQSMLQSTCMRNPGLCAVTRKDGSFPRVNNFMRAKYFFKHGGNICTWDPGMGIPSREKDPAFYNISIADSVQISALTCKLII